MENRNFVSSVKKLLHEKLYKSAKLSLYLARVVLFITAIKQSRAISIVVRLIKHAY